MDAKKCSKCKQEKPTTDFPKNRTTKDGLGCYCKSCESKRRKNQWANKTKEQKEKALEYNRMYYKKTGSKYYNPKKLSDEEKKDRSKKSLRRYYNIKSNNKKYKEYREKVNNYTSKRRLNDETYCIRQRISTSIALSLKRKGYAKHSNVYKILGCEYIFFKEYIENKFTDGMSWENRDKWHLDHIIPVASAKNEEEIILLNHYLNFQPLWACDNMSKSDKYKEEDKIQMLRAIRQAT